jgi:hypothetical protein
MSIEATQNVMTGLERLKNTTAPFRKPRCTSVIAMEKS